MRFVFILALGLFIFLIWTVTSPVSVKKPGGAQSVSSSESSPKEATVQPTKQEVHQPSQTPAVRPAAVQGDNQYRLHLKFVVRQSLGHGCIAKLAEIIQPGGVYSQTFYNTIPLDHNVFVAGYSNVAEGQVLEIWVTPDGFENLQRGDAPTKLRRFKPIH